MLLIGANLGFKVLSEYLLALQYLSISYRIIATLYIDVTSTVQAVKRSNKVRIHLEELALRRC